MVILSDLFDDLDAIMQGIERLRFQKHEVILFHLWDRWERDLPLEGHCKFHDLETGEILTTQADGVRDSYLAEVRKWQTRAGSPVPQPRGRSRRAGDRRAAGPGAARLPGEESEELLRARTRTRLEIPRLIT